MITNIMLNAMAGVLNGESPVLPNYLSVGTSTINASATDTALDGEVGSRFSTNKSRIDNVTSVSGIRSGVSVIDNINGDSIKGVAFFDISSNGNMLTVLSLPGLLQTTSFDIEFNVDYSVVRRS